jgi:hypothetical protein
MFQSAPYHPRYFLLCLRQAQGSDEKTTGVFTRSAFVNRCRPLSTGLTCTELAGLDAVPLIFPDGRHSSSALAALELPPLSLQLRACVSTSVGASFYRRKLLNAACVKHFCSITCNQTTVVVRLRRCHNGGERWVDDATIHRRILYGLQVSSHSPYPIPALTTDHQIFRGTLILPRLSTTLTNLDLFWHFSSRKSPTRPADWEDLAL